MFKRVAFLQLFYEILRISQIVYIFLKLFTFNGNSSSTLQELIKILENV